MDTEHKKIKQKPFFSDVERTQREHARKSLVSFVIIALFLLVIIAVVELDFI